MSTAGSLAMEIGLGRGFLMTHRGMLGLRAHVTMPDTVMAAAIGRHVGEVFDDQLFAGGLYPIESLVPCRDGSVLVTARTGFVPLRLPEIVDR